MTTTDVQKGAVAAAPQTDDSDAGPDEAQRAESAANELLAKARYDAFKLVTDARTEAESVLDEARAEADGIVKQATMTAESLHDAAKFQADELLTSANAEHDAAHETRQSTEPVETTEALEAEHEEGERGAVDGRALVLAGHYRSVASEIADCRERYDAIDWATWAQDRF